MSAVQLGEATLEFAHAKDPTELWVSLLEKGGWTVWLFASAHITYYTYTSCARLIFGR